MNIQICQKKIKPKFKEWETGKLLPTWNQLCDISRYFKRPTAFFFREKFPEHINMDLIEYRKLDSYEHASISPTLTLGIRDSISKRRNFIELMKKNALSDCLLFRA